MRLSWVYFRPPLNCSCNIPATGIFIPVTGIFQQQLESFFFLCRLETFMVVHLVLNLFSILYRLIRWFSRQKKNPLRLGNLTVYFLYTKKLKVTKQICLTWMDPTISPRSYHSIKNGILFFSFTVLVTIRTLRPALEPVLISFFDSGFQTRNQKLWKNSN